MRTHRLIYDNLSFSDICHDDPWSPIAFEVRFSSGKCSVYWTQSELPMPLESAKGGCRFIKSLARCSGVPAIGLDSLLRTVHEKNWPSAHNSFFYKEGNNRINLEWKDTGAEKQSNNSRDLGNACNFLHSLHPQISLWLYRTINIFESCMLAARDLLSHISKSRETGEWFWGYIVTRVFVLFCWISNWSTRCKVILDDEWSVKELAQVHPSWLRGITWDQNFTFITPTLT